MLVTEEGTDEDDDTLRSDEAFVLGGPLKSAVNLYKDLQAEYNYSTMHMTSHPNYKVSSHMNNHC